MNDKITLHGQKPASTHVNKKVVAVVVSVVVLLISIVIISALQSPTAKHAQEAEVKANMQTSVSDAVKKLPQNYTDNIGNYLPSNSPLLKQQMDALKQSQADMQQKLDAMRKNAASSSGAGDQAIRSNLFFSGNAPEIKPVTNNGNDPRNANRYVQPTAYQQQNMQDQKKQFLDSEDPDADDIYNMHTLAKPISPYEVQAGTLIPAALMTAVNTSLPGQLVARVRENVYDTVNGNFLLIPQGSKLIGEYDAQVAYGQSRVLIVFYRIIRPDGSSIILSNSPGADLFGNAGGEANVDNHWGRVMGAAVLSTVLSMGAGVAADNSFSNNSNDNYRSATQNAVLGGAGNISSVGQSLTNRAIDIQPTLTMPAGYEFNIIVNKDMVLEPSQKPASATPFSVYGK